MAKNISEGLKLFDVKKENLRKSYEDILKVHSSLLSSFTLAWSDFNSHIDSLQSLFTEQFNHLQSLEKTLPSQPSNPPVKTLDQSASKSEPVKTLNQPAPASAPKPEHVKTLNQPSISAPKSEAVPPRPDLKKLCEKMDGVGLRKFIIGHANERNSVRAELSGALRCAPDPAAMVLDAMNDFYRPDLKAKGDRSQELCSIRRASSLLLEELMGIVETDVIKGEVKERATKLAKEWKGMVSKDGENTLEALGFCHLVAAYGLVSEFDVKELLEIFVHAAKYRQATGLCRILGFSDRISDIIEKLIKIGKQILAVKFIYEFDLTVKFPPVPLLKDYVKEAKKLAETSLKKGGLSLQSLNEVTAKEVSALRSVLKIIEDHKLESEYPPGDLEKRAGVLEEEMKKRKRSTPKLQPQQQQQQQQQQLSGNKRPRTTPPLNSTTLLPQYQPSSLHQNNYQVATSLLPDRRPAYLSSPTGLYGLTGSTHSTALLPTYSSSSSGMYGLGGGVGGAPPMSFSSGLSPPRSHLYSTESRLPAGYYDRPSPPRPSGYGGYQLPPSKYLSSYYP